MQLAAEGLAGTAGIGHTRWATHGIANETNAHPHATERMALVHNGIIENFRELREELAEHGIKFTTETDTETVALLTGHHMAQGMAPLAAVQATLKKLHGAFALAFLFQGEGDLMIGARKGSPLALGHVMSGVGTQSPALPEEESLLPACFIIVEPQPFIAVSS